MSSKFCAGRSRGRTFGRLIGPCSQRQLVTCHSARAVHVWSLHGRCCVGIGRLCAGSGASRLAGVGGRRLPWRFRSWCCGSHARIRAGVIGGSAASWPSSASGCRRPASSIVACNFFTVESLFLRRYYALFFIAHGSRRVWRAGCTTDPTGAWVTQQARNLGLDFSDHGVRFLIRDGDSKYSGPFDEVFGSEGIRTVKTPVRAPKANAIAERFVRTVRTECLDWLLILNRRHLECVLRVYVDHYGCKSSRWTGVGSFARVAVGRG